jgi:predicted ATPase/tRNA A-37 threonylcarbamoyl transferase component Bud32
VDRLSEALGERYAIERQLGEGGMATVYLAEDLKHKRRVAIKVLRPELAAVLGAERFEREITTTAGLRHPHILPLYDSGKATGPSTDFLFYVMPYVEGETLRDRLDRETQLPVDDAICIADQVAEALHYAHGRGVIHRDIKPENILLEDGRAVVADFGIAHAVSASGGEKLTATGMSVGTPHYMSPEQASGEPVDARSDLYALGCLLYEMLAGSPPFTGPTAMAIIARHLTDPVPRLSTIRPVPDNVADALNRALGKTPADRYVNVEEWRQALVRPAAAASAGTTAPAFLKQPPMPATPLIGREDQLAAGENALRDGARVLTITGVGGTGKTRFATELFRRLHGDYVDGAAFISLASVTDANEVMPTVGLTLDIAEAHGRSALDAVVTVIGDRRVFLVLDNLEQVIEAAGDIADLVSRCPALQVIATSRSPLKIGAEMELALPPLALPNRDATEADELMSCPSVALFVQRAEKVKRGFTLSAANAVSVAAICRRLDGLPLALELAAARVRILEPAALLQRLDRALDLLTSGDRDLPERQRTLRATISWSYSLLTDQEQRLLRRLSTFHEGWTLEALEQVCFEEDERFLALDELDSLVEKDLVHVVGDGDRYTLLDTIRAFAAEQLQAGGEVDAARDAHADFFVELMRGVDEGIHGDAQVDAIRRGRADNANTFAALEWLIERARAGDKESLEKGMLLCGSCAFYWHIVGLHLIGREAVDVLLALAEGNTPSRGRALALWAAGMVSANTGEMERTVSEWTRMVEDGRAIGDDAIVALALAGIGYAQLGIGLVAEAGRPLDEAIALAEAGDLDFLIGMSRTFKGMQLFLAGDPSGGATMIESARKIQVRLGDFEVGGVALSFHAQLSFAEGDLSRALEFYREAEASFEVVGDKPEIARVQCEMGYTALAASDLADARRQFQRALQTYDEVGSPRGTGQALIGLAATEAAAGNTERAVTIAVAAQAMSERAGVVVEHAMAPGVVERIEELRASIPQQQLDELVSTGSALSPSEVLAML